MVDLDMPIDELEVSVRTSGVLAALGAETLGALLALPEIKASSSSIAELQELFEELGVEYSGEFVAPPAAPIINATGSLEQRWSTIREWLEENQPEAYEQFRGPASEDLISQAESELGMSLPDDYRRFMAMHNGQHDDAPAVEYSPLVAIEKVAKLHSDFGRFVDADAPAPSPDEVNPAIKPVHHNSKWIPVAVSARGRDYILLDMDPSETGAIGQVIFGSIDADGHALLAPSFSDFLSLYFSQLQNGELEDELDDFDELD